MNRFLKSTKLMVPLVLIAFLTNCGDSEPETPVTPVQDCSTSNFSISVSNSSDVSCNTGGSITLSSTNGEGVVRYSIDGFSFLPNATFDNLEIGDYTIEARDENDCMTTTTASIGKDATVVSFTATSTNAGCGTSEGTITVTASGGDGNYQYSIAGGDFASSNTFAGLTAGRHTIDVKDGNSCESSERIQVLSGTGFSASIRPIINQSCATTGCHVAGTGRQDFTIVSVIIANASGIKSRTQSGSMPKTGTITQEAKDLIACWVDDGALQN